MQEHFSDRWDILWLEIIHWGLHCSLPSRNWQSPKHSKINKLRHCWKCFLHAACNIWRCKYQLRCQPLQVRHDIYDHSSQRFRLTLISHFKLTYGKEIELIPVHVNVSWPMKYLSMGFWTGMCHKMMTTVGMKIMAPVRFYMFKETDITLKVTIIY